jgi:surface protein
MFYNCRALTSLNVSSFDTSKVTDMFGTFGYCHKLSVIDVSSWNTSLVTNMNNMFSTCEELLTIYASNNFVTTSVTDSDHMWSDSHKLKGGQGTVNTGGGNKIYARIDGGTSAPGYFTAKP